MFRPKQCASPTISLRRCAHYLFLDEQTACVLHLLNCSKHFCSTCHFPVLFPFCLEQQATVYEI